MRTAIVAALLLLAFVGCGGDDDSDSDGTRAGADTAAQTETAERPATGTAESTAPKEASKSKRKAKSKAKAADGDTKSGKGKRSSSGDDAAAAPPTSGGVDGRRQAPGSRSKPRIKPSKSAVRCLRRATRESGEERLAAQARCVKLSSGRLRKVIRAQCRKTAKSEAAYRSCIRVTIGG